MIYMDQSLAADVGRGACAGTRTMVGVLNAMAVSERERFLASESFPGPDVLEYSISLLRDNAAVGRIIVVGYESARLREFDAPDVEIQMVKGRPGHTWRFQDCLKAAGGDSPALVISPYAGPVSPLRLSKVCDAFAMGDCCGVVVSAYALPDNANPSWLHVVPRQLGERESFHKYIKAPSYVPTMKSLTERMRSRFSSIAGAQWLPSAYKVDAAVVAVNPNSPDIDPARSDRWDVCMVDAEPNSPVFAYRLPVWSIAEDVSLTMD